MARDTFQDASDEITTSNISQEVFAEAPKRELLIIQNISETENLYVDFGEGADAGEFYRAIMLEPGKGLMLEGASCPRDAVYVIGVEGEAFVAKQIVNR
jgi:hypothetical protein